jgi:protein O-GlcNAc transferase
MDYQQLLASALQLHQNGQFAQAEKLYQQVLQNQPKNAAAWHLLGVLLYQNERYGLAIEHIQQAVHFAPRNSDYWSNLGLAYKANAQLDEAMQALRRALELNPKDMDIQLNLGNTCQALARFEEAAGYYRRVLRVTPQDNDVRQALCLALQSLGNQCQQAGRYSAAAACYEEAISYISRDASLYYNLGNAQRELGLASKAEASYRKALSLDAQDADTYNNLGNVLREQGKLEAAIQSYQTALQLNPDLHHARVHSLHQQQHICDWRKLAAEVEQIRALVNKEQEQHSPPAQVSPFAFLAMPATNAAEQKRCASQWLHHRYAQLRNSAQPFVHQPRLGSKIRIGYLSADFRLHPLAALISELLELHDRTQFEIHAYAYGAAEPTPARKRLEQAVDYFHDINNLSLHEAAQQIFANQIDILVDLTGYTQSSRTGIVALKPAPISVNWLGYPGTMGAWAEGDALFDYLISDAVITPPASAQHYAEKLVLLPHCYQPNDSLRPVDKPSSRLAQGLPEQAFVFCCFNQSYKILPAQFAIWMDLLSRLPDSVLWLLQCNSVAQNNLLQQAALCGIASERIIFAPRVSMSQHLARLPLADLFLDTLPYNAHTSASEALWMSLPVLTCMGDTFPARVAASILYAAKLPELVTHDVAQYQALAFKLATEPELLQDIRQRLHNQKHALPLFDTTSFARGLEQAYRLMWQRWQAQLPVCTIDLTMDLTAD